MPISMMLLLSVVLVAGAAIQCFATLSFRRGIFFGVTVDPEFSKSENAKQIVWRYRRPILAAATVCIAALWTVVPRLTGVAAPLSASGIIFLEVTTGMVSMAMTSRHVRPYAKPHSAVRTVSLAAGKRTLPGGYALFAGPMIAVGVGLFVLLAKRGSMPAETYRGGLALLLVAFICDLFYLWVAWMMTFRMRQVSSGTKAGRAIADRRMGYFVRLVSAYVLTALWVYLALLISGIAPAIKGMGLMMILSLMWIGVVAIIAIYVVRHRSGGTSAEETLGDTTPDANWKWGIIYYNPADPALVVESRAGRFGCDLNFGNQRSQLVCGAILTTPLLIRLLWFWF